jgi:hypothetical protein
VNNFRPMLGNLLIDVVFVEGPPGSTAALTQAEKVDALRNVYTAGGLLRILAERWARQQTPQPVKRVCEFTVTGRTVRLNLDPGLLPTIGTFNDIDAKWLDPTLAAMGLGSGDVFQRVEDHRRKLFLLTFPWLGRPIATTSGPLADAFPIFVTNYPCHKRPHSRGGMVILPWTAVSNAYSDNLDGLIAHETGHVFGAPDEYGDCTTDDTRGFFDTRNTNCALVSRNPDVPNTATRELCIMDKHAHHLCSVTPLYWGWRDIDHDGVPDLMAPATVQNATRPVTPGTTETVTGRNVWDARLALFDNQATPDPITILSPTSIEVKVPPTATGTVTITLLTRAGPSLPAP